MDPRQRRVLARQHHRSCASGRSPIERGLGTGPSRGQSWMTWRTAGSSTSRSLAPVPGARHAGARLHARGGRSHVRTVAPVADCVPDRSVHRPRRLDLPGLPGRQRPHRPGGDRAAAGQAATMTQATAATAARPRTAPMVMATTSSAVSAACTTCRARIYDRGGDLLSSCSNVGLSGGDLVLVRESAEDLFSGGSGARRD